MDGQQRQTIMHQRPKSSEVYKPRHGSSGLFRRHAYNQDLNDFSSRIDLKNMNTKSDLEDPFELKDYNQKEKTKKSQIVKNGHSLMMS